MVKRMSSEKANGPLLASPGLRDAPVLDLMCSHFVLTLVARMGGAFSARRDLHGVIELVGRHLVWPLPVLQRLREYLARRCAGNEQWAGHDALDMPAFLVRFGEWR